jgi:predicted heme/steroid binding protein
MKRWLGFLLVGFAAIALLSCTPPEATTSTTTSSTLSESLSLTLAELAEYDGKDGMPAYIAVDGVIYDVTNSSRWSGGQHNGYFAGRDLTTQIQTISPHGVSVLEGLPVVGQLVE